MTDSERLRKIMDSLFETFLIKEDPEHNTPGTYESWASAIGHPVGSTGRCITCGRGITCTLKAFYEVLVDSTVRELNKHYTMYRRGPAAHKCICGDSGNAGTCPTRDSGCPREGTSGKTFRERCMEKHRGWLDKAEDLPDEEPDLNHEDVRDALGPVPSYRCYVSRHKDCEVGAGQAEEGCTCSCHPGAREKSCGALADHDPHDECWGNGPFRVVPEDARSPYRRRTP